MGLSGRKVKQRIGNDPRNLSWADDAARFGSNYLAKFGWDASKGLGAEGEGRTSHLKVAQKLDMLGIGAAHQKDPNGIAWKQNRDFENLLKRLNEASAVQVDAEQTVQVATVEVFEEAMDVDEKGEKEDTSKEKKKKKKEKRSKEEKDEKEKKKEKKKKEKKEKDGKRKRTEDEESSESHKKAKTSSSPEDSTPAPDLTEASSEVAPKKAYVPRHRAHRARAIAAKSIALKSSVHISEILGIASSSSHTTSQSVTPPDQGKLTVISEEVELEKITTSTKSVADYFKERLLAKANKTGTSTSVTPTLGSSKEEDEGEEPKPRGGLGFSRGKEEDEAEGKPKGGLGFSRVSWEEHQLESNALRMGLSKFSSLMSSTVLSSTASCTPSTKTEAPLEKKEESNRDEESDREERKRRRKEKRLRKEEKGRKKEAKKRKAEKEAGSSSPGEEVSKKEKSKGIKKNKSRKIEDS